MRRNIQAFVDLKKYIQASGHGQVEKYWSGNLLFHNNAFEEALKAYKESAPSKDTSYLMVKCHLKLHQLDAVNDMLRSVTRLAGILPRWPSSTPQTTRSPPTTIIST